MRQAGNIKQQYNMLDATCVVQLFGRSTHPFLPIRYPLHASICYWRSSVNQVIRQRIFQLSPLSMRSSQQRNLIQVTRCLYKVCSFNLYALVIIAHTSVHKIMIHLSCSSKCAENECHQSALNVQIYIQQKEFLSCISIFLRHSL